MNCLQKRNLGIVGIVVVLTALSAATASATSSNVVVIPHTAGDFSGAGTLPTGAPDFSVFTFTDMAPSAVNSTSLAPFDTAVLYLSAVGLNCNTSNLPTGAKAALNAFVAAGGKLIIYDAECTVGGAGVDYAWLPFPFQTKNPGATGFTGGNLTITEQNVLSTSTPGDPNFINTTNITLQTDAVGDMNVVNLTTVDPNWCLDMTGTNVNNDQGAVHMYAKSMSGTGLYIYNGLDTNYILSAVNPTGGGQLTKIWKLELNSTASLLPCSITVVGITLTPANATNPIGTTHTVTATLTNLTDVPQPGVTVNFSIISGPNSPFNASGTTNASGQASFTYTGSGGAGTDKILACFTNQAGTQICSRVVTKEWITPLGKPGKVVGWGNLGSKGSFNLWVYSGLMPDGTMEFTDTINKVSIEGTHIDSVLTNIPKTGKKATAKVPKTGTITGMATVNGAGPYAFTVKVVDAASPGAGKDMFTIDVSSPTPYHNSGTLTMGDITVVK